MTSIDPFAHRAKALEAAASPQFVTAGVVHAIVYLGDQLARLNDLADTVASGPPQTGNDGAPLGEVVHDEVVDAEVVDSPKVWTVEELDALPDGWTVHDRDGDAWEKAVTRPDGTSLWRCCQGGAFRNSQAVIRWINPEPFVGHALTIDELNEAPWGAIVVDSDLEEWEKTLRGWYMRGMNVNAPSACPLSSKSLFESRGLLIAIATEPPIRNEGNQS